MTTTRWSRCFLAAALCAVAPTLAVSQQASYYVLDGFGGVHAGGDAPAITPATPFFGFDIARDLAYVAVGRRIGPVDVVGDGLLVLDGFGGIHAGGALPRSMANPVTPYFGFDVARAITARNVPPRISAREDPIPEEFLANGHTRPVTTATIRAPDDGFLLVMASLYVECQSNIGDDVLALVGLGLDSTSLSPGPHTTTLRDCNRYDPEESFALVKTYPVSAGAHFVHLIVGAQNLGSSNVTTVYLGARSLQLLFIDQDHMGGS